MTARERAATRAHLPRQQRVASAALHGDARGLAAAASAVGQGWRQKPGCSGHRRQREGPALAGEGRGRVQGGRRYNENANPPLKPRARVKVEDLSLGRAWPGGGAMGDAGWSGSGSLVHLSRRDAGWGSRRNAGVGPGHGGGWPSFNDKPQRSLPGLSKREAGPAEASGGLGPWAEVKLRPVHTVAKAQGPWLRNRDSGHSATRPHGLLGAGGSL